MIWIDTSALEIVFVLLLENDLLVSAARVLEAMNKSVDPCDDFYRFACDGWVAKHPIPQSQVSWDQLSLLREYLLQDLRILLEMPDEEDDLRPVKLARALYKTCMDTGKIKYSITNLYDIKDELYRYIIHNHVYTIKYPRLFFMLMI